MDLFAFIQVANPTKVRVVERERRVVLLLPVASARAESELETNVDKLFDEGGSADQGILLSVSVRAVPLLILLSGSTSVLLVHLKGSLFLKILPTTLVQMLLELKVILLSETGTKITSLVHASMFHDSDSTETVKADDAEFNVGTARQACLNAKLRMQTEHCLSERKRLNSKCKKKAGLLKARDDEVEDLKAQLLLKETEAAKARNVALENENDYLDGKVTELQSLVSTKDLELKDLNVDVSSLKSQNEGLVHALETTCSSLCDPVSGYERLKEQIEEF
nr:hypothetical protein [Tanacetum cinerariifolium]